MQIEGGIGIATIKEYDNEGNVKDAYTYDKVAKEQLNKQEQTQMHVRGNQEQMER